MAHRIPIHSSEGDATLAKVRKLLAKAEDPATSAAEAEALTAKAAELMAKYGIDRALLDAQASDRSAPIDRRVTVEAPYALDKATLLYRIAEALGCKCVLVNGTTQVRVVHVFGFAGDLERAELLYTSLLVQSAHALAQTPTPRRQNIVSFRKAFLAGFTRAVVERLAAAEKNAAADADRCTDDGPSTALVLADRRHAVQAAYEREYPTVQKGRRRTINASGYANGHAAGAQADLGGTRFGSGCRAALGGAR